MASSTRKDLKPKRYHFYAVLLFILGTLFPPLAVAARFGFGGDFWLNLVLTICGYIPGHGHNFYIQNIRNNKTHRRTPKWAQRYGLVDTSEIKRKERKSQWAKRYDERNPHSTLEGAQYEEGQVPSAGTDDLGGPRRRPTATSENELWNPTEENFYGRNGDDASSTSGAGRWHYPINADDALPATPDSASRRGSGRKKKEKKDRWARTEDAYAARDETRPKRKKSRRRETDELSQRSEETTGFPEDPEGGLYGPTRRPEPVPDDSTTGAPSANGRRSDDVFSHQF